MPSPAAGRPLSTAFAALPLPLPTRFRGRLSGVVLSARQAGGRRPWRSVAAWGSPLTRRGRLGRRSWGTAPPLGIPIALGGAIRKGLTPALPARPFAVVAIQTTIEAVCVAAIAPREGRADDAAPVRLHAVLPGGAFAVPTLRPGAKAFSTKRERRRVTRLVLKASTQVLR
jgi:hypothetical protein